MLNQKNQAFILGAPKCATTSMSHWLNQHPQIFLAKGKETNFFHTDNYQHGMSWYEYKYFKEMKFERIALEATPNNFHISYTIPRIKESVNDPRFIIMIREPMTRAYSNYNMIANWRPGRSMETFEEEMNLNLKFFSLDRFKYERDYILFTESRGAIYYPDIIEQGLYYTNLMRWIGNFGIANFIVLEFESLLNNRQKRYDLITDFLCIEKFQPIFTPKKIGKINKKLNIKSNLIELCKDSEILNNIAKKIFKPEVEGISKLLGVDFIKQWEYDKL